MTTTHSFKSTTLDILQPRFCKVDYRSVNVQWPNSTQDNTVLMIRTLNATLFYISRATDDRSDQKAS